MTTRNRRQLTLFPEPDRIVCSKCGGTGIYAWGAVVNGVPSKTGKCFPCKGKGWQNRSDRRRTDRYWDYRIAREVATDTYR